MANKQDRDPGHSEPVRPDLLWWSNLGFGLRLAGMLLVAAALLSVSHLSEASTTTQDSQATHAACQRMLNGLVEESGASAIKVVVFGTPPSLSMARIFVSDGEVRITCDDSSSRMSVTRVVNQPDTSIDAVGLFRR